MAVGLVFGAADQYAGSLSQAGAAVSNLSAPWLLLAFGLGCVCTSPGMAARTGLAGLVAAVAGYTAMIMTPAEGVRHLTLSEALTVSWSQARWLAAALVIGPLYGILGHLWRARRSALSAVLVTVPLLLEPPLNVAVLHRGLTAADYGEIAAGLVAAVCFRTAILVRARADAR